MEIEFDPAKDKANMKKHGVSLAFAKELNWDLAFTEEDTREAYGEQRMVALCPATRKLYHCTYVERGYVTRIISLREAVRQEYKKYERAYKAR